VGAPSVVVSTRPAASVVESRTTTVVSDPDPKATPGAEPALTIVPFSAAATRTAPVPWVARAETRPVPRSASATTPRGPPITTGLPATATLVAGTAITRSGAR